MESKQPSIAFAVTLAAPVDSFELKLIQMLDGCDRGVAIKSREKPCPVILNDDSTLRRDLVDGLRRWLAEQTGGAI